MSSIQCINCNVRLDRIRRHLLMNESEALVDTIRFWTYPREITPSDHICHACWELATHSSTSESTTTRHVGHRHVCVVCGRSILRMRTRRIVIQEPNEQEQRMIDVINNWIRPREVFPEDEACIPCWLRAQRASRRSGQPEPLEMVQPENVPDDSQDEISRTCCLCGNIFEFSQERLSSPNERQILEIISELMEQQKARYYTCHIITFMSFFQVPSISEVCSPRWERAQGILNSRITVNEPRYITLPNIRRAAETPGLCIFRGCTGSKRRIVPEETRRRILLYFIPRGARICNLHLHEEQYGDLYAAEYSLDTFSSSHIEETVFILMECLSNVTYENIQNYPEHQVQYFIGLTKRQHQQILQATPSLRNLHRGSFALTALHSVQAKDWRLGG
ncbi:hypothetical protein evm_014339 [Chilo suppressalis]|nr:hypothetical protein evm_014339 [Chilo suppressalis]